MNSSTDNLAQDELAKFEAHAGDWWAPRGPLRPLHAMNPVRLEYLRSVMKLDGSEVLDVGCGGGILAEAMARAGARVTAIDAGSGAIDAARTHMTASGLHIDYRVCTVEQLAETDSRRFDAVTCMELLEHVPRPDALLAACAGLLRPGGHLVLSTLNRTLPAYLGAILGAEFVFRLLPRGTHDYARFIRPSELERWLRACGMQLMDVTGIRYLPWVDHCTLTNDPTINYIAHARLKD